MNHEQLTGSTGWEQRVHTRPGMVAFDLWQGQRRPSSDVHRHGDVNNAQQFGRIYIKTQESEQIWTSDTVTQDSLFLNVLVT